jgi:hypothetical protein
VASAIAPASGVVAVPSQGSARLPFLLFVLHCGGTRPVARAIRPSAAGELALNVCCKKDQASLSVKYAASIHTVVLPSLSSFSLAAPRGCSVLPFNAGLLVFGHRSCRKESNAAHLQPQA